MEDAALRDRLSADGNPGRSGGGVAAVGLCSRGLCCWEFGDNGAVGLRARFRDDGLGEARVAPDVDDGGGALAGCWRTLRATDAAAEEPVDAAVDDTAPSIGLGCCLAPSVAGPRGGCAS